MEQSARASASALCPAPPNSCLWLGDIHQGSRALGLSDPAQEASILLAKGSVVLTDLLQVAQSLLAHLCLNLRKQDARIFSPCRLPLY